MEKKKELKPFLIERKKRKPVERPPRTALWKHGQKKLLGEKVGLPCTQSIYNILKGRHIPSGQLALKLSAAAKMMGLPISVEDFLQVKTTKNPYLVEARQPFDVHWSMSKRTLARKAKERKARKEAASRRKQKAKEKREERARLLRLLGEKEDL